MGACAFRSGGDCNLPLQGWHDSNAGGVLRGRRHASFHGSVLMRRILLMLTLLTASVFATPASAQRVSFANAPPDGMPKDFVSELTGQGKPGKWAVVEDATTENGRALAQLDADPTD